METYSKAPKLFMVTKPLERSFLVAQTVKNLAAMKETWVLSLGQVDPLEKETATHSSTLARRILGVENGVTKSRTQLSN